MLSADDFLGTLSREAREESMGLVLSSLGGLVISSFLTPVIGREFSDKEVVGGHW